MPEEHPSAAGSRKPDVYGMCLCALFAALTAVCAQITVPIGPVPISLSLLAVHLCGGTLSKRRSLIAMAVYLIMGVVGLPVFSNLTGGPGKLFGPTGGYILGYLPCVFLEGLILEKWGRAYWKQLLAMAAGVIVCYCFGTVWFMILGGRTLGESMSLCVTPFLPGDAVKIALAALIACRLEPVLRKWKAR